jgi:2-oxoglutarate ferredoxin oxidoreductase subunit delta
MVQGKIVINENLCLGCGYCVHFCANECITISDKFNAQGFLVPSFTKPESCTACGSCARMCPQYIIDVYKYENIKSKN